MGKLIPIKKDWVEITKDFTSLVEQGKITQAAMIYKMKDGSMEWSVLGTEDEVSLIGLAELLKFRLCADVDEDQRILWEEGD